MMKKWVCKRCGYVHEGNNPPERCPVCGAPASEFEEQEAEHGSLMSSEVKRADVIVVGTGGAAFSAAITAKSNGASVIMLEKAEEIGGTTARSGGGMWIPGNHRQQSAGYPDSRDDALRYMARYSFPHLYRPDIKGFGLPDREFSLLEAMVDNAPKMIRHLEKLGVWETIMEVNWKDRGQVDYQNELPENRGVRGRTIYAKDPKGKYAMGFEFINQLSRWANANGIDIVTGCEVKEILISGDRVTGVMAEKDGEQREYVADKAVIFGSGGYSHNPEYMLQFQRGPHFGGCSVPTNTGDFIRMAGAIGARIGNTAGAFRAECMIEPALKNPGSSTNVFYISGDSVILVNKYGNRFVNEKRNYTDRAMAHFVWDPNRAEWKNMLAIMIYDSRTAELWAGMPPYPVGDELPSYIIKADTIEEMARLLDDRFESLKEHTGGYRLSRNFSKNLSQTIERYNRYAQTGRDSEFKRGFADYDKEWTSFPPIKPNVKWPENENYCMYPISSKGPYYSIILAPGTLDTNGGPVIDSKARVLDWNDRPIKGLYGAGNCIAAPSANAYWGGGGTLGPGLTFAYIAAMDATYFSKK